jgi:RNA polymerase sigma factor (sigma-70 family)
MGTSPIAHPDETDYDAFFDECLPVVLGMVQRMTGSRVDAEDVAIEALGRAYLHWGKVRWLPHRRAWVLKVATNLVVGQARRRQRPVNRARQAPEVADAVVLREALLVAMAALPRRQREAVALRYLTDLSEAEAATAMGVSVGSVKTHVTRGLAALRAVLGPEIEEGGRLHV